MANCEDEHRYWNFFEHLPDDQKEQEDINAAVVLMKEDTKQEPEI